MLAAIFALALAQTSPADDEIRRCPAPFDKLLADEVVAKYPAQVPAKKLKPASPQVKHGLPHLFRTVIRGEAAQGPNFAGHYTLVSIGCGAGTTCVAVADAFTGRVVFSPVLRSASLLEMDTGEYDVERLNFRQDSRLLIVVGLVNEDLEAEGASYYVWRSGKFTQVRFTPAAELCSSR